MSEDTVKLKRLELFSKYAREDRLKAEETAARARQEEARASRLLLEHVKSMHKVRCLCVEFAHPLCPVHR